jgi:alanyl-tRNA synthetase
MIPPTERLFWSDAGLVRFDAAVVALESGPDGATELLLDRTAFYPEGGGQPFDLGRLSGREVVAVLEREDGRIVHRLAPDPAPLLRPGERVEGEVDADRRRDHREQHSAQHLFSALAAERLSAATVGFHLGPELSTVDFDRPLGEEELRLVEEEANRIVAENRQVRARLFSDEELLREPLRKPPPAGVRPIRIVEIEGVDRVPCGGTHVDRTGEIRLLLPLSRERLRGGTRIGFVAGGRAVRFAREFRTGLADVAALFDCGRAEAPARARTAVDELRRLRREVAKLKEGAAEGEAARLAAGAVAGRVVAAPAGRGLDEASMLARLVSGRGLVAFVFAADPASPGLAVATPPGGPSALELARPFAELLGGRGGGGDRFARYSAVDAGRIEPARREAALEAARAEVENR